MTLAQTDAKVVRVTWVFPGLFPVGHYKVYALIPEKNSTAQAALYTFFDNKATIDQMNQGDWVFLGDGSMNAEDAISIVLKFSSVPKGDVGVDTIAIVRVK